jgi:hypothetical protein
LWTRVGSFPLRFTYYQVDKVSDFFENSPVPALAYPGLWAVGVSHPVTDGVDMCLTYAGQVADPDGVPVGMPEPEDQKLLMLSTKASF